MKKLIVFLVIIFFALSVTAPALFSSEANSIMKNNIKATKASTSGTFAFVSEFTSGGNFSTYGWKYFNHEPKLTNKVNFYGEESIMVPENSYVYSFENVTPGQNFISFQAAVYSMGSNASISVINSMNQEIASILIFNDQVYAGYPGHEQYIGNVNSSIYPSGWNFIIANIQNTSTKKQLSWTMQVFVDETDKIFANVSVPLAYSYAGIELSSNNGDSYFTDIIFTSYQIAIYDPGYNPMEGYGQGSGLVVSLLPPFTEIHANMVLNNWSVPESGILSFQINVMNYYGTTRSSGVGFFQLGVDLDPGNHIAPWYVPGKNMIAHYFLNSSSPAVGSGFYSPNGTELSLTIEYLLNQKEILFQIIDSSVSGNLKYWNATIPYNGTEFYGSYTQLEFQPSSSFPIQDYYFNGSLYNITIGNGSDQVPLNDSYMLPFELNAPSTWSMTYYGSASNGYKEIA